MPASGCVMSFTRRFQPPRFSADLVLDLGMPGISAGAAVASCDRDVPFYDALGRYLFAGSARRALVRRAQGFRLLRQGLEWLKFRHGLSLCS